MKNKFFRFWMWVGIILLLYLAAITIWKRWYWFFPSRDVSEVYTKYAGTDGLNVAYLKDFRINDSLFVDVTLLEAKNTTAWSMLKHDFRVVAPKEVDTSAVTFWFAPRNNYLKTMDTVPTNNDIIVMHYYKQTLAVIAVESIKQIDGILSYHIINLHN